MEQTLKTIRKVDIYGIHFDIDKATIRPEAASTITDIAETLRVNPDWRLMINGHTDSTGKESYNLKLSQRRAEAVVEYLINASVEGGRLSAKGFGESTPIDTNETTEGKARNRRVEFTILEQD